jgi:hypothetical protein
MLAGAPLAAQNADEILAKACNPPQPMQAVFSSPRDRIRVPLCAETRYYAQTNLGGVRLNFRPLKGGTAVPIVMPSTIATTAAGGQNWTVNNKAAGLYELTVDGMKAGAEVTLSIRPMPASEQKPPKDSAQ